MLTKIRLALVLALGITVVTGGLPLALLVIFGSRRLLQMPDFDTSTRMDVLCLSAPGFHVLRVDATKTALTASC
jgi:hypothetical protein